MSEHTCPACERDTDEPVTGICRGCANRLIQQLREIAELAKEAEANLMPGRSGEAHSAAYGSRPPLSISALDYAATLGYSITVPSGNGTVTIERDGLGMLHEWERLIREERNLVPVALVPYAGSHALEIVAVLRFLTTHLPWATQQAWAVEMVSEVSEVHRAGQIALRAVPARAGRIACPGERAEGGPCGAWLTLPTDWDDYVRRPGESAPRMTIRCHDCDANWTVAWLLKVAVSMWGLPALARAFGKDVIAHVMGISERQVNRIIAKARLSDPKPTIGEEQELTTRAEGA